MRNGFRSILTMLGIIIGVAAVITMLAVGAGTQKSIRESIAAMGANMLFIVPGGDMRGQARTAAARARFDEGDLRAIQANATMLSYVSPVVSRNGTVRFQAESRTTSINGVEPSFIYIRALDIADGRNFNDQEAARGAKVVVIGQTIIDNLFGDFDPIGQTIRFDRTPFTVVGTLVPKGQNSMGQDQDDIILAPFNTVQRRLIAGRTIRQIIASVVDESLTQQAIAEVADILRAHRRIREDAPNDFQIHSQQELGNMMEESNNMMTALLTAIAAISLLVGGIGIMNIMFVSVIERTREIGLRMAVGAKGKDILMQFLIEAIMISLTGGVIGMLFGVGASFALHQTLGWAISIAPTSIIISFAVCVATGMFFGWYPAFKASKLDPIEALRFE